MLKAVLLPWDLNMAKGDNDSPAAPGWNIHVHLGFQVTHSAENADVDFMKHEEKEDEDGRKQEKKGSG